MRDGGMDDPMAERRARWRRLAAGAWDGRRSMRGTGSLLEFFS